MESEQNSNKAKKMTFEDLENKGRTFEDESEEFAGDNIKVKPNFKFS